ncbi:ATP-dependent DNA helicase, RecQ family [Dehalogenimonas lykanthroporepellens BL-DC-9]|nr:ATP-dependent DNA helicase, RecQ family [Dehalogenimonas lykanthroporepellens BL-DC-9]
MAVYSRARALELLRVGCGKPNAKFREGQEEAIRHIVEGKGRLLVVQKTGWGKSFVYFIAVKLLREQGHGPALLISPLLSLMRNQIQAAEKMGVKAVKIDSTNEANWTDIEESIKNNEIDILLISPERLENKRFNDKVLSKISDKISLIVIDEAHCISDWGHDFRPQYRLIERIIKRLPRNLRMLATTATANNRVMDDLKQILGPHLMVSRGELTRYSLVLQTIIMPNQAERLAWLAEYVPLLEGNGIIYTLTVRDAYRVANWLKSRGLNVEAYTSESENREKLELALLNNNLKALVSTVALGMGYDKPDLAFVIHYQTPGSVVAYYQQVGRAGRALKAAHGILFSGEEDTDITDYFIDSAFPSQAEVSAILNALLEEPSGLTIDELTQTANIGYGRIKQALQLLSLESPAPVVKDGYKWQLTAAKINPEFWERITRLTELRKTEQRQMQDYVRLNHDHMEFLVHALDGDINQIYKPRAPKLSEETDPNLVKDAVRFLQRTEQVIEPRLKWPVGYLPIYGLKGYIPTEFRNKPGKALCVWGDAGWGQMVRKGKYTDSHYPDELVTACVQLYRKWNPQPAPAWVTCIPSTRHPNLVPEFAARLARELKLPFVQVLKKRDQRPEQKTMANSYYQALNLDGSLEIKADIIPNGPVLLVDDMVDSRWTLTIAGWLLTTKGSGPVWPMALSVTSGK